MIAPFTGSCACGSIRYTCSSAPIATLNCHCLDCQLSSGAPFASGFIVAVASTQVTGTPTTYTVTASSGGKTTRSFCATCGTPLFARGEAIPDFMSIRYPTLDDAASFKPMLEIWTSRAPAWTCLDAALPHFAESPPGAA